MRFVKGYKHSSITNLATSFYALFVILLLLESGFMFVSQSHGGFMSLSSKIWLNKYWKPINSFGYRDDEPKTGSSCVLFVGDSYTEGHGINHVSERFSNQVKALINSNNSALDVINLGRCGSNTSDEFLRMKSMIDQLKLKPKAIVLQYCFKDIEDQAFSHGLKLNRPALYSNVPSFTIPLLKNSFLLDYIYWGIRGPSHYIEFLEQAYQTKAIREGHFKELDLFVNYCDSSSIELIPVIIPFMEDLKMSEELFVEPLRLHFESLGIEIINVSDLVSDMPFKERIVNNSDRHASVKVNKKMAVAIEARLQQQLNLH